jgi:hypothetical protein
VRVTVVSAVHRSELERPPRLTVDSTAWKAWLCPLRHFFDQNAPTEADAPRLDNENTSTN